MVTVKSLDNHLRTRHKTLWVGLNHHRTHLNKPLTLKNHYYLKEILLDSSRKRVLKKSTQGGISEGLIIISWTFANEGKVVFYVLPTDHLMKRFVSNRYEKSLTYSSYYRSQRISHKSEDLFKKKDLIDNKSLKDIGEGVIAFAGSQSDVPFIELPADIYIVDEADLCDPNRLQMGKERLGHSSDPHEIYVGNPTFVGSFLDDKYNESSKGLWQVKADCGHWLHPDFFKHIVKQEGEFDYIIIDKEYEPGHGKDIKPICDKCGKPFDRFGYGTYVEEKKSEISGKHINRIFSGTGSIVNLVDDFSKALENDYKMQRFYNSGLGLSFTAAGAKLTIDNVLNNVSDYMMPSKLTEGHSIIGIDVGNLLHVRINQIVIGGIKKAVYIGTVNELEEIYELCKRYRVIAGVMDGLPEIRMARKFSHSHNGRFRCFFGGDKADSINAKEKSVTVSRLQAIDNMKEALIKREILFPKNILNYDEYLAHIQTPVRVWDEEREVYSWESNKADHFFFAEVYCNLAEKVLKFIK